MDTILNSIFAIFAIIVFIPLGFAIGAAAGGLLGLIMMLVFTTACGIVLSALVFETIDNLLSQSIA